MWRIESTHRHTDTLFLDQWMNRIESDKELYQQAESILEEVSKQEPVFAQSLLTPQDVRYHAEGPVMRDHLRLMLMTIFAIAQGRMHLLEIEELRRLKGYEGEIEELEECIAQNVSLFELFTLCHDIGKWVTTTFSSISDSRGERLGFNTTRAQHFDEAVHERMAQMDHYQNVYASFAQQQSGTERFVQAQFYTRYGINVHYPNHARKIHAPVFSGVLERLCNTYRLSSHDQNMLEDLIAHHMECGFDFKVWRPARIKRYIHISRKRGYDADTFIDLAQACLFLDHVAGSIRLGKQGYWHDPKSFIYFLKSEHDFAPYRRAQKEEYRQTQEQKKQRRLFQEVGLDGLSMMDLLEMDPGPEFGRVLRRIHAAVLGKADMPALEHEYQQEIEKRAGAFYQKQFKQGE